MKFSEIQWCDHIKADVFPIQGYGVAHIKATGCVLIVGQGKVRVVCESCTPDVLEKLQAVSILDPGARC